MWIAVAAQIIVVTATAGYRHESIGVAEETIAQLAGARGVNVVYARDEDEMRARLTPDALRATKAVLFVNTTGELPSASRDALLAWVNGGGTFVGFHSASDTWHSSPEYIAMLGGEFASHGPEETVAIVVENPRHKAAAGLPTPHTLFEEIYAFTNFDPARVDLLLSIRDPIFQPIAWTKTHGRGRVLYTALGHREDVWTSLWFRRHAGGMLDAALLPPKRRSVGMR